MRATVTTDPSQRMKLQARVRVVLDEAADGDAPFVVAVKYAPTSSSSDKSRLAPLWSANATLRMDDDDGGGARVATIDVFRLRPSTDYDFHVFISAGGAPAWARLRIRARFALGSVKFAGA